MLKNLWKIDGQISTSKLWPIVRIWGHIWIWAFLGIFTQHMGLKPPKTFKTRFLAILDLFDCKLWVFQSSPLGLWRGLERRNMSFLINWNLLIPNFDILRLAKCRIFRFLPFFEGCWNRKMWHFNFPSFFEAYFYFKTEADFRISDRCHHKLICLLNEIRLKRICSQVFLPLFMDLKE